jgi:hypoxanthine phosphoribosyltransferase
VEAEVSVLYPASEIQARVRDLGKAISRDYAGRDPVLVSVLKGGTMFLADLFRAIQIHVRVDFMSISPYGPSGEAKGVVRILKDLDLDIMGQHVIVVEDIVDTGLTLTYLLSVLQAREPASLAVCTLLDKSVRRITPIDIGYRGFDCPDRFVVGYGLDYAQRYRNLPFILAVPDPSALADDPGLLLPYLDRVGRA